MIDVEWWLDSEFPSMLCWNAYLVSDPTINGNGGSVAQMEYFLVWSYNARNGTSLTADDFTWTEVPRPS